MRASTSDRIRKAMNEAGMRQVDVLEKVAALGPVYGVKLAKSELSQYLSGKVQPKQDKMMILAQALGVSEAWLMGYDVPMHQPDPSVLEIFARDNGLEAAACLLERSRLSNGLSAIYPMKKIPLLGSIACGTPILAQENISDYVDLPGHIRADYALSCKGDSMINAGIRDGDIVYMRQQETVENGQIAAVMVGAEDATLKRFYHQDDKVTLLAENTAYPPMVYVGEEACKIRVIGLAVAYTHVIE